MNECDYYVLGEVGRGMGIFMTVLILMLFGFENVPVIIGSWVFGVAVYWLVGKTIKHRKTHEASSNEARVVAD